MNFYIRDYQLDNKIYNNQNLKKNIAKDLFLLNIKPNKCQLEKLLLYLNFIFKENQVHNLIGTKNLEEILSRHFYDCLAFFKFYKEFNLKENKYLKIIDVGTGPGLPGILLAIFLPNAEIFLLDSKSKFTNFLKKVVDALNLQNIEIINNRAEIIAHEESYREIFDVVVSRAVAEMKILSELLIPLCKIGGKVVMYKGKKVYIEVENSKESIAVLGAKIDNIIEVDVPKLNEYRSLVILTKIKNTLCKYPRKYGRIIKKPVSGN